MLLLLGFTPEHLLNFGNFAKILCKSQFSIHKMMFSNSNEPLRFTLFLMGGVTGYLMVPSGCPGPGGPEGSTYWGWIALNPTGKQRRRESKQP